MVLDDNDGDDDDDDEGEEVIRRRDANPHSGVCAGQKCGDGSRPD